MKRKLIILVTCTMLLLSLTACNGGDSFKQGLQDGMNAAQEGESK